MPEFSPQRSRRFGAGRLGTVLLLAVLVRPAWAQTPQPPAPDSVQLDRIERKLDEVLRRLGASSAPPTAVPGPAAGGVQAPADAVAAENYVPGAVAVVHAAPSDARGLGEVPADSVGGFVYTGGPIALSDLSDRGVRYTGLAGVELQGWLRAKETGRYQIAADVAARFGANAFGALPCTFAGWLEGQSIGSQMQSADPWANRERSAPLSLVLGAELRPGLYKLRLWTACVAPTNRGALQRLQTEILVKAPSDLNLRPVTGDALLHRPG